MAAAEKTVGQKFWDGARIGAGLFMGLELIAYLINPVFAGGVLFYGTLGGAIAGTFGILDKITSSSKPSSA
jgi:hypothetical protein